MSPSSSGKYSNADQAQPQHHLAMEVLLAKARSRQSQWLSGNWLCYHADGSVHAMNSHFSKLRSTWPDRYKGKYHSAMVACTLSFDKHHHFFPQQLDEWDEQWHLHCWRMYLHDDTQYSKHDMILEWHLWAWAWYPLEYLAFFSFFPLFHVRRSLMPIYIDNRFSMLFWQHSFWFSFHALLATLVFLFMSIHLQPNTMYPKVYVRSR